MTRQIITVDIAPEEQGNRRLAVSQYDTGRPLGVRIARSGEPVDCSEYTVRLYIYKPDRTYYEAEIAADPSDSSLIIWETDEQQVAAAGACIAEIRLSDDGVSVGTANFAIWVEGSPSDLSWSSESESKSLIDLVDRAEAAADTSVASTVAAAQSAQNAQADAERAETARGAAETASESAGASATAAGQSATAAGQSASAAAWSATSASQSETAAAGSASSASQSETAAGQSASSAAQSASSASQSATSAGQSASEAVQNAEAARQSATSAWESANAAGQSASDAVSNALKSEGYAVGQQNGTDVPSTSPYYQKNAKYYAEYAEQVADSIPQDYTDLSNEVSDLNRALTSSIDYLANSEQMRVYPVWEIGAIDSETGENVVSADAVRSGYIDKNAVAKWNIETHTGYLYVYRYNYVDGVYTYLGRNQRTSAGDFTNWLKSLAGTHLRFVNGQNDTNYPNAWMTLCYSTQIGKDIESLKTTQTKTDTIESNLGYWRQYLEIPAGSAHPGSTDILPVDIKTGQSFMLRFSMNKMYGIQIYAYYADGTNERIMSLAANDFPYAKSLYHISPKSKDIIGLSQYTSSADTIRTCITEVIIDNSISNLINYSKADRTAPRIQTDSEIIYFETGRARYDVNNIHQCIAVWNNQVWEFGEGKAAYNGVVYELENGHGNNCNWGITLHGNYPYLYCPTWTNNETKINVFTFDGSAFTLDHIINLNLSGYMDAYIDEFSECIYAFTYTNNRTGNITFTVADLLGNILSTKEITYRIPVIQGMCLHNGVLYVTSGFATQEFPNYLNLISTDGTLLGRYPMYNIEEIEGIDFMDNEMILASYYAFYIHPTKLPNPFRLSGIFDQLEATT